MSYAFRAVWGTGLLMLIATIIACPAAAEVACKVQLIRGSATVNGKPLSIETGMRLKVSVAYNAHNVQCEVVGGKPPYHFFFTIQAGTPRRRTINHDKEQSSIFFGMVLPSDVVWNTLRVKVQDATGKSVASMGGADPAANDLGTIRIGDVIETGPDTRVTLTFPDEAVLNLKSNSRVTLKNDAVRIEVGGATFTLLKFGSDFLVETPNSSLGVLGTKYYVETGKTGTSVYVSHGRVWFKDIQGKKTVVVGPGQMSHVAPAGVPSTPQPYAAGIPEKLFENEARTGQLVRANGDASGAVYLIEGGYRRWITDMATLQMVAKGRSVDTVDFNSLSALPFGLPITRERTIRFKGSSDHQYVIYGGQRHWISAQVVARYSHLPLHIVPDVLLLCWPEGSPAP